MLVDLHGAAYNQYDPEVTTLALQSAASFLRWEFIEGGFWKFQEKGQMLCILPFNGAKELGWQFQKIAAFNVHKIIIALQFWNCILLFQTIKIFIPDANVFVLALWHST